MYKRQAIHYYEENEIEVGKPMDCQVVVNHVVKLTAEEKAEARQNAVRKYQEEELRKLQNRHKMCIRDSPTRGVNNWKYLILL